MNERIIKYFIGELTDEEQLELLKERDADSGLKREFSRYQNMMAMISLSPLSSDKENALSELRVFKQLLRRKKIKRIIYHSVGYAAAISLIIVTTLFFASNEKIDNQLVVQSPVGMQELYVPIGQRARLTLPDGTVAWLNAGSTISYPSVFSGDRNVLLSGEAYFEVFKNEEQSFIVETGTVNIKALGTSFNVSSYPRAEYQNTILLDGIAKVYKPNNESEGIILSPGQQLFYEDGLFRKEIFTDYNVLLWKDGIYSFENAKLDAIISKLELYFDVDIIINCPTILDKEYTGKFRQKDGVMEILRIIEKIHPFNITKNEDLNQIILSR